MNAMTSNLPDPIELARDMTVPAYDARALLGEAQQANIVLDNQIYTLRITRAGKLILTK